MFSRWEATRRPGQDASLLRILPWLLVPAVVGFLLILYATRWGPWAYSDSVEFLGAARNLAAGRGLGLYSPTGRFMSLELHPPLYPLLLAGGIELGLDVVQAARWIAAALFAVVLMEIGLAAWGVSRSLLLSLTIAAIVLVSARWVDLFSGAMTEPLFLVLVVASLCALVMAARSDHRGWILLAGILAGMSILTRFAGMAVLGAGVAFLLLFRSGRASRRLIDVGLFLLLGAAPLTIWMATFPSEGGSSLGVRLPEWREAWQGLAPVRVELASTLWGWVPVAGSLPDLPYRWQLAVGLAVIGAGLGLFAAAVAHRKRMERGTLAESAAGSAFVLLGLFVAAYVAVVALAYVSRDIRLDLIGRTLLPISLGLSAAALCLVWFATETWGGRRWAVLVLAAAGLVLVIEGAAPTLELAISLHEKGRGYTSAGWHDSGVIRGLAELDPELVVVTNEPAAIELWTGRVPFQLEDSENEEGQPASMACCSEGEPGAPGLPSEAQVLALFDSVYGQWLTVSEEETEERIGRLTENLSVYSDYWDGTIYLVPGK